MALIFKVISEQFFNALNPFSLALYFDQRFSLTKDIFEELLTNFEGLLPTFATSIKWIEVN